MAARAGITRQSMGEIIRELVDLDLLEMRPDPSDGRAKIVTFSEHGREFTSGGNQHIGDMEQRFVEGFGVEDYETARRVLEGIGALLHELTARVGVVTRGHALAAARKGTARSRSPG